jgi:hypothetical protein
MSDVIDCPSCRRKLYLPAELPGRLVKCPTCAVTFTAPDPTTPAVPPPTAAGPTPATPPPSARPLAMEAREVPAGTDDAPRAQPRRQRSNGRRGGRRRAADRDLCPSCREPVPDEALECPFCGEALDDEDERPWERGRRVRRDCEPHRGGVVLTLGIVSLVAISGSCLGLCIGPLAVPFILVSLALGIPAWVMGQGDLRKIDRRIMDPDGESQTRAGMVCGMIGTIISSLVAILACMGLSLMFALH